jgi:hypothetical protein
MTHDGLFIVVQHTGQNVDHFTIATRLAQHVILQLPEGRRQFQKERIIPKDTGLALHDRQIEPLVINRPLWQVVAAFDDPRARSGGCPRLPRPAGLDKSAGSWNVSQTLLQPGHQGLKIWEVRHPLQYLVARNPNIRFHVVNSPTCRQIAEIGRINKVVHQRDESPC